MTRSFRSFVVTACCTAAALLSACGPATSLPPEYTTCASPKAICFASATATAQCVDLSTDTNNCGECGNVCGVPQQGGTAACVAGQCVQGCQNGLTVCGVAESTDGGEDGGAGAAICIDTTIDPNHCGSCDTRCGANQICTAGACVAAGQPGQGTTACGFSADGGVIYQNLLTDRANCGACGNACVASEICLSGACTPCAVNQCNNSCVDTNTDPANCGACGTACTGSQSCAAGVCTTMAITVQPTASTGFLPTGSPTVTVGVASGIRVAAVTVVAKLNNSGTTTTSNLLRLGNASDVNVSPALFAFSWASLQTGGTVSPTAMPGLITTATPETVELDFTAYDEQYRPERPDAAAHTATLTWNGSVATPTPVTGSTPSATTTVGGAAGTALANNSWVPLNGAPITLTETLSSAPSATANIVGIEFHSTGSNDVTLGGKNSVLALTGAAASITVNPNDLGVGTRSITAFEVDVFGGRTAAGTPLVLTVGDITLYTGTTSQPILAFGTDSKDSIWLYGPSATAPAGSVCASGTASKMFAQPFDQPATNATSVGTVVDGATTFCVDNLFETWESTGVYGVKSDGTAIARFDGVAAENAGFITAPGGNKFARIEANSITAVAMAIDDTKGNGWFGNATIGVGDQSPVEAGGTDGGSFESIPPVGGGSARTTAASTSGALWSWVAVPTGGSPAVQSQLDIFHPAITTNHVKSYLATGSGKPATPETLSVFPGGEFVWEEADTDGNLAIGAGRFDGTNPPVDITGATLSGVVLSGGNAFSAGVKQTLLSSSFFVPKPGILVGLIPSQTSVPCNNCQPEGATQVGSAGYEMVEIDLTATPAKIYHPQTISLVSTLPSGQVLAGGVTDRYGSFDTFTVSDDLKKVLYVTKTQQSNPTRDEYNINLLDLATGTVTVVYTSEFINNDDTTNNGGKGGLTMYPHFLHGMNSYSGLSASSTTPPIIIWGEELPGGNPNGGPRRGASSSGGPATLYQRLFYANYSGSTVTPVQIDHLALAAYQGVSGAVFGGGQPAQVVAESVVGNAIYFLSDDGGSGELSLYSRAFDGSAAAQRLVQGVSSWQLREDIGRQLVLRSDGMLLSGPLTGALAPIYKSDGGQYSTDLLLYPLSGFSPDGTKAWVLDQFGLDFFNDFLVTGILVSVDVTTGARTDWGEIVSYIVQPALSFGFVGPGASALYGVDFTNQQEQTTRYFYANGAAATQHVGLFNVNANSQTVTASYAANLNEAVFSIGNSPIDVTPDKTTGFNTSTSVYAAGPAARVQPNATAFGPNLLPLWELTNSGSNGIFKQFGTATYQAPITVSAGTQFSGISPTASLNRQTPDNKQLLTHYSDNGKAFFVMKLPGTGVAPLVGAVQ